MKILFLSAANSIHTIKWVNALAERGNEVVLVSKKDHKNEKDVISKRVKIIYLPIKGMKGYYFNSIFLKKIYQKEHFDIINVHYASGYGTLARLAKLPNILLSVWGSDVYDFPYESKIKKIILKKNLENAAFIASTSYCMKKQTEKFLCSKKKIWITPFGVDTQKFLPANKKIQNEKFTFGIVKTLSPKYGISTILKAFSIFQNKILKEKNAESIVLEIYGDGRMMNKLKNLARKLKIDKQVFFRGYIPNVDVPLIMQKMDVFLLGSRLNSESFGVAAVEAMACGLPVIATEVSGFKEVIEDGKTGFLVPIDNEKVMAKYMAKLYYDKELRLEMGKNGRKRAVDLYDWKLCVDNMVELYKNIITERNENKDEKRCIFHIPNALDPNRASASQIRPLKMAEAFRMIGYKVDIIQGYGKTRKKQIRQIKMNIRNGVNYSFLYSESSTMPTLLTEKNHFPAYPCLDFGFFKYIKKHGINIGLFYRDMFWKFPEYKAAVKGIKYYAAKIMYIYDLLEYKKYLNKFYLPTYNGYKYLNSIIPKQIINLLPPGCDNYKNVVIDKEIEEDKLNLIYVGGLGGYYEMEIVLRVISQIPQIELFFCCRKDEWEKKEDKSEK